MADVARTWLILTALQQRLQEIRVTNGYRTDAGADVRLEPGELDPQQERITLYCLGTYAHGDMLSRGEREMDIVVEASTWAAGGDAHGRVVAIAEDVEQALDRYLQMPLALPLQFEESVFLERPEGVPAMVAQLRFTTRYRR